MPFDPFIVTSSSTGKATPKTRRLIRSYVMRGKNTKKPRPKRVLAPLLPRGGVSQELIVRPTVGAQGQDPQEKQWILAPPRRVASELSMYEFTIELTPPMRELLYRGMAVSWRFVPYQCLLPVSLLPLAALCL